MDVRCTQPARVPKSVKTLVVLPYDISHFFIPGISYEDILSKLGVILNRTIFIGGELAGLDKDTIRNQQLADVVQKTCLQNLMQLMMLQVEIIFGPMLGH